MFDERIREQVKELEKGFLKDLSTDSYRLKFHLMPPVGWLNDPNGLCQFKGIYHVFFQYSPLHVNGGMKAWGHYTSADLVNWNYVGAPFYPDKEFDKDGVYSGSALIADGKMHLYYTGNVKQPGDHDYISSGREANTVYIVSEDGINFSEKKVLLRSEDYPSHYTCHIRDPKVWEENGTYYMVLGGRQTGDKGAVLVYESKDKLSWSLKNEVTLTPAFGYMWECPDYIELGGKKFFACSPQGVEHEEFAHQNMYSAGYFLLDGDIKGECTLGEFIEWDMGFDFYAPQTFTDEHGRTILISWAGVPDAPYSNASIERGWQHSMTVPRVLREKDNKIYQYPVNELLELRGECITVASKEKISFENGIFDLELTGIQSQDCHVTIADCVHFECRDGVAQITFEGDAGCGRDIRKAKVAELESVRILADTSLLEIYLNDGEYVFTTRYYKEGEQNSVVVDCENATIHAWKLKAMEVTINE